MHDQGIGAGLGERLQEPVGMLDHQVDLQRQPRDRAQPPHDHRAEGQIRHEMAVHHVDVDPVGPGPLDLGHLLSQAGRVGREDRGGELHRGLFRR